MPDYKIERTAFNPARQPWKPTPPLNHAQRALLTALGRAVPPDFALAGGAQSDGLTFIHKRVNDVDLYFVCNLEPNRIATEVTFRVSGKAPQRWDAITGEVIPVTDCRQDAGGTTMAVDFEPWESAFFVFAPGKVPARQVRAPAPVAPPRAAPPPSSLAPVATPRSAEPVAITGPWRMRLAGYGFESYETQVEGLASWTDAERTRHFSGTGRYEIEFTMPAMEISNFKSQISNFTRGGRVLLDLGRVGNIAEVQLNGQAVGVAWMSPYRLDVTRAVRAGQNRLVVFVTNTLINYVAGLKNPPEVPEELQARLGKANPAVFPEGASAQHEMSETDLPPSGLMGPVQIIFRD